MRRILYVQHSTGFVGAPTSLLYLIEGLDKTRFIPFVLFYSAGPIIDLYASLNIEIRVETGLPTFGHVVPGRPKFRSVRPWQPITGWLSVFLGVKRYKKTFNSLKPDIVHVNSAVMPAAALAAKTLKIPVVWHIREQLYHGLWGIRKRIFRKLIEFAADKIIVLSQASRSQFSKTDKVNVIYNFVDFQSFNRHIDGKIIREKLHIPSAARVVGFMGGGLPHKGGVVLLEAMKYVHENLPDTHLIILGNTSKTSPSPSNIKRSIRHLIEKVLNLQTIEKFHSQIQTTPRRGNIHLVGSQKKVPEWIAACDLIVFPSIVDHFARPIIEAGAMAKPVVASDWPSTCEIVEPGPLVGCFREKGIEVDLVPVESWR